MNFYVWLYRKSICYSSLREKVIENHRGGYSVSWAKFQNENVKLIINISFSTVALRGSIQELSSGGFLNGSTRMFR